ncbi:MAG: ATP-binding cassette domain-containing protein [Gammaproteobacteria bacterium]
MIQLSGVSKRFGAVAAVQDVSLTVPRGTTHVLLGSSGCGKSTILRLILGLTWPDVGTVAVDGVAVTPQTRAAVIAQIGYVVQSGGLFPHLTATRNVTLPAEARGWTPERIRPRLDDLAAMVGFDAPTLARLPAELSGGQRQRVSLMRALMLDPPVLLLDEPLGALDPLVRADLQTQLREIFSRLGKTVVMVTHDVAEAVLLGATISLMTGGRVVQHGSFEELARRPAEPFVTEFLSAQAPPPEMAAYLRR